jgi:catechol 2,3-dioxygenase-like lactoylglutathione lyase family enzyme
MPNYATVGTDNPEAAAPFYAELLGLIGWKKFFDTPRGVMFRHPEAGMFAVLRPYDGEPATVGNGSMVGFAASSREVVDALHAKALELGGTDEGAPGERGGNAYFAYFRDLDGNKLCAFHMPKAG